MRLTGGSYSKLEWPGARTRTHFVGAAARAAVKIGLEVGPHMRAQGDMCHVATESCDSNYPYTTYCGNLVSLPKSASKNVIRLRQFLLDFGNYDRES